MVNSRTYVKGVVIDTPICEMVVGYTRDKFGDADEEIYCTNKAYLFYMDVHVCDSCAKNLTEQGCVISDRLS